jgi:hypothetical protein
MIILVVSLNEGAIAWDVRRVIPILAMGIAMEKEDFFRSIVITDIIGASLSNAKLHIHPWRNDWLCYELKIGTDIFYWVADMISSVGTSFCVGSSFFTKFTGLCHFYYGGLFFAFTFNFYNN